MIALSPIVGRQLEPRSYCEKYSRRKVDEYGYKGAWVRLLAHSLGISHKTVETWGSAPEFANCPDRYKKELSRIEALKVAEEVLRAHELDSEYLKKLE